VVPKIKDSPTAAGALIRPKRNPSAVSCAASSHLLATLRVLAPSGKSTGLFCPNATSTLRDFADSSRRKTPLGSVFSSMDTV
jgi:hypothetical protein